MSGATAAGAATVADWDAAGIAAEAAMKDAEGASVLKEDGDMLVVNKDVKFGPIHVNNVGQLRQLQEATLPVRYQDKFYSDVLALSDQKIAKLAYFRDLSVGAACCRVESVDGDKKMLYVMTLAVLPAYRGRGIGTQLVNYMIRMARELGAAGLYLHVWTNNTEAVDFYKRLQFSIKETIPGYYKRIDPPDCHILELLV